MPDLHLPVPLASKSNDQLFIYPGLFIEVKTPKGKLTKNQQEVMSQLTKAGNLCHVIRSADQGIALVNWYLAIN